MRFRIRPRRTPGHHWKLITATLLTLAFASGLAFLNGCLTVGFAILLGIGILAVQWFSIDVPGVDDADLH